MKVKKILVNKINRAVLTLCAAAVFCLLCGCDNLKLNQNEVSETDATSPSDVSSQQPIGVEEAVSVYAGETKVEDLFILKSDWYGEQYQNENSLNQLMIVQYMYTDSAIPQAENNAVITFKFASEEKPESVKLTQQGNTFKANTGIPYNIIEIDLSQNQEGDYCFTLNFAKFSMYYYTLDCVWSNGNTAQYAFVLERAK